jgi:hypothetical protein
MKLDKFKRNYLMATSDKVNLIFDLLTGKDTLNPALKTAQNTSSILTSAFGKLGLALGTMGAAFSLSKVIDAAKDAEQAMLNLDVALASNGNFSEDASKNMENFAKSLQKTTIYSDESILSAATLLENLTGLDQKGLQKVTQSTIDFASAMNKDLDSAAMAVSKAIEGNGTSFQKLGIRLNLTKDAATNVGIVLQGLTKFQDQAALKAGTYAGATARLENSFHEILKTLGKYIVENEAIIGIINDISTAIYDLLPVLNDMMQGFIFIGKVIKNVFEIVVESVLGGFAQAIQNYVVTPLNWAIKKFNELSSVVGAKVKIPLIEGFQALADAQWEGVKGDLEDISKAWDDIGKKAVKPIQRNRTKIPVEIELSNMDKLKEMINNLFSQALGFNLTNSKSFKGLKQGLGDIFIWASKQMKIDPKFAKELGEAAKGIGASIGEAIKSGAEGGKKAFAALGGAVAGSIATALGGPIAGQFVSGIAGPLLEAMSSGAAAFGTMIADFLSGFIDAAMGLIDVLLNPEVVIDKIINRLIERLPEITQKLTSSLIARSPLIGVEIVKGMIKAIPQFVDAMVSGFINGIKDGISSAFSSIGNIFGGGIFGGGAIGGILGGGVGSVVGGIGDVFGFAEGGIPEVKSVKNGYLNDTFPASLTSGELIVDRNTSSKLKDFLSGNGSNDITNGLLNQILQSVNRPMTINTSVEVNRKVFADIILDLNRTNARLA